MKETKCDRCGKDSFVVSLWLGGYVEVCVNEECKDFRIMKYLGE